MPPTSYPHPPPSPSSTTTTSSRRRFTADVLANQLAASQKLRQTHTNSIESPLLKVNQALEILKSDVEVLSVELEKMHLTLPLPNPPSKPHTKHHLPDILDHLLDQIELRHSSLLRISKHYVNLHSSLSLPSSSLSTSSKICKQDMAAAEEEDLFQLLEGEDEDHNRAQEHEHEHKQVQEDGLSTEIEAFIAFISNYENLLKGVYLRKAVKDGLWTKAMTDTLTLQVTSKTKKRHQLRKKLQHLNAAFDKTLQFDERENNGYVKRRSLKEGEGDLKGTEVIYRRAEKEVAKLLSVRGNFTDKVAALKRSCDSKRLFNEHSVEYFKPRVRECQLISSILDNTAELVKDSTVSLKRLFKRRGEELVELERRSNNAKHSLHSTDSGADNDEVLFAKQASDLRKAIEKNIRMAEVATVATLNLRENNARLQTELSTSELEITRLSEKLLHDENDIEETFVGLQTLTLKLEEQTTLSNHKEQEMHRNRAVVQMKQSELSKLEDRLDLTGTSKATYQSDLISDVRRLTKEKGMLVEKKKKNGEVLQELEQVLYELELKVNSGGSFKFGGDDSESGSGSESENGDVSSDGEALSGDDVTDTEDEDKYEEEEEKEEKEEKDDE